MGVDYKSNFGIGYELPMKKVGDVDVRDILDDSIDEIKYSWFEYGDMYEGDFVVCVVINEPFIDGVDKIKQQVVDLANYLTTLLDYPVAISDIDVVGGLLIS